MGGSIFEAQTTIQYEQEVPAALEELKNAGCNALAVFLGNFGPEGPETMLAERFDGPCMFFAAAEENIGVLSSRRGDAYCGMLSMSVNMKLRGLKPYIPEYPVGTAQECAKMLMDFVPVARALIGLKHLKVITFGPRPFDFFACNAPIAPLFKLGVNIQENSELDLLAAYNAHKDDPRIPAVMEDMAKELGEGNKMPGILPRLAQYEVTLLDWIEENKGACDYVVMANKCWPAFQTQFGFVPCYVNSRFTARGIPIACEVDIWGAVSEFIGTCITGECVTLLDINNSVPADMFKASIQGKFGYELNGSVHGLPLRQHPPVPADQGRNEVSADHEPRPGRRRRARHHPRHPGRRHRPWQYYLLSPAFHRRLQAAGLRGGGRSVLPVATESFGGIGVFAIPEMGRFYRYGLIANGYPHHGAVAFGHVAKAVFDVMKLLGVEEITFNRPKGNYYPGENPFK